LTALHKKKEQRLNAPDIVMSGEACGLPQIEPAVCPVGDVFHRASITFFPHGPETVDVPSQQSHNAFVEKAPSAG
jgi:hypothetical protein